VITLCEYARCNLIIDLSWMPITQRNSFIERLLRALLDLRTRSGRPHWLLIDEIQQSYAEWTAPFTGTVQDLMRGGGVTVVSYRPSLVDPRILNAVQVWALTRTTSPEDLACFDTLLSANHCWAEVRAQLPHLARGHALILPTAAPETCTISDIVFRAGTRRVPHIRHLHKYVTVPLPNSKWFVFRNPLGTVCGTAANLSEFRTAIERVPLPSLVYHLERGDFARWLADSLHDSELSRQITKIAHRRLSGAALRSELRETVSARYDDRTPDPGSRSTSSAAPGRAGPRSSTPGARSLARLRPPAPPPESPGWRVSRWCRRSGRGQGQ